MAITAIIPLANAAIAAASPHIVAGVMQAVAVNTSLRLGQTGVVNQDTATLSRIANTLENMEQILMGLGQLQSELVSKLSESSGEGRSITDVVSGKECGVRDCTLEINAIPQGDNDEYKTTWSMYS